MGMGERGAQQPRELLDARLGIPCFYMEDGT